MVSAASDLFSFFSGSSFNFFAFNLDDDDDDDDDDEKVMVFIS